MTVNTIGSASRSKVWQATAALVGGTWRIQVAGLDRPAESRYLREVEDVVRGLVAGVRRRDPAGVRVEVEVVLPARVRRRLDKAARLRQAALEANTQAAIESRAAATELHDAGLTLRDIGTVMGLSHQRVHQLLQEARPSVA